MKIERILENIVSIPLWPFLGVNTFTHWDMVKEDGDCKFFKKATYSEIKRKMLSVNWEYDYKYPGSLFDRKNKHKNYFHASIFRFGDVGYLLTPYGYLRASILQKIIRKKLPEYKERQLIYID